MNWQHSQYNSCTSSNQTSVKLSPYSLHMCQTNAALVDDIFGKDVLLEEKDVLLDEIASKLSEKECQLAESTSKLAHERYKNTVLLQENTVSKPLFMGDHLWNVCSGPTTQVVLVCAQCLNTQYQGRRSWAANLEVCGVFWAGKCPFPAIYTQFSGSVSQNNQMNLSIADSFISTVQRF